MKMEKIRNQTVYFRLLHNSFSTVHFQPNQERSASLYFRHFTILSNLFEFHCNGQVYNFHYDHLMSVSMSLMFYIFGLCVSFVLEIQNYTTHEQ